MDFLRGLIRKKQSSSTGSAARLRKEQDYYLKNGSALLEELLTLCDGNCRIPIRYFSSNEIERATEHSENNLEMPDVYMVAGSLDKRLVLIRFFHEYFGNRLNSFRDIAITAQMSHLKNVLRLVGCCLEFEKPVMVYEYVEALTLDELLFNKGNARNSLLSWGSRLRIANEVASTVLFLHTEFTTPIIHRDLKPSNVIIDQNSGVAKLFNLSYSLSLPPGELEVVVYAVSGTYRYLAPEFAASGIVSQKIDVHSFGVVLLELLTGKKVHDFMKSNIREGNVLDKVDSAISVETIQSEEDTTSSNFVDHNIKEGNVMNIADVAILEEHGIEIRQQLEDYLDLVKKCTADKGEDRPYMIEVAKELRRIHMCFRALTLGQN